MSANKIACLFPGQGSQSVGMGKDFYDQGSLARDTFAEIDQIAGRSLSQLCFEGPEAELKRTINTQPTILAASLVAWNYYKEANGPQPTFVAGHSLGEFTALVASDALSLEAAVRLVEKRATLMEACPKGAMSAVIGLAPEALEKLCTQASVQAKNEIVIVANYNTREQLVISGNPEAVTRAGDLAKAVSGKVIPLPVGGAFHSSLMASAASEFENELAKYTFADAQMQVVQNFDAKPATKASDLRQKLSKQMPSSVHWLETIEYMLGQGVKTFIEIGPGKVLSGMVKKIDRSASIYNISDTVSLKTTLEALNVAVPSI